MMTLFNTDLQNYKKLTKKYNKELYKKLLKFEKTCDSFVEKTFENYGYYKATRKFKIFTEERMWDYNCETARSFIKEECKETYAIFELITSKNFKEEIAMYNENVDFDNFINNATK